MKRPLFEVDLWNDWKEFDPVRLLAFGLGLFRHDGSLVLAFGVFGFVVELSLNYRRSP